MERVEGEGEGTSRDTSVGVITKGTFVSVWGQVGGGITEHESHVWKKDPFQ